MLSENFSYVVPALPALLIAGLGFGFIFGPVQNAATSGVSAGECGVASTMVDTAQQIGGGVGWPCPIHLQRRRLGTSETITVRR